MEVEMIQMLSETGEKQYPVTSSEAVGMSDGSGNLDAKLAELESKIGSMSDSDLSEIKSEATNEGGYIVSGSDGSKKTNNNWRLYSINVLGCKKINLDVCLSYSTDNNSGIAFFDEGNEFISGYYKINNGVILENITIDVPDNAVKALWSIHNRFYDSPSTYNVTIYYAQNEKIPFFNSINIEWKGDRTSTLNSIFTYLRKKDLIVSYSSPNGNVTEKYIRDKIDDESWISESNWAKFAIEESPTLIIEGISTYMNKSYINKDSGTLKQNGGSEEYVKDFYQVKSGEKIRVIAAASSDKSIIAFYRDKTEESYVESVNSYDLGSIRDISFIIAEYTPSEDGYIRVCSIHNDITAIYDLNLNKVLDIPSIIIGEGEIKGLEDFSNDETQLEIEGYENLFFINSNIYLNNKRIGIGNMGTDYFGTKPIRIKKGDIITLYSNMPENANNAEVLQIYSKEQNYRCIYSKNGTADKTVEVNNYIATDDGFILIEYNKREGEWSNKGIYKGKKLPYLKIERNAGGGSDGDNITPVTGITELDGVEDYSLENLFDKNNTRAYDSDFAEKVNEAIGRKTDSTGCYSNNIPCKLGDYFTRSDFGTGIIVVLDSNETILGDIKNVAYSPTIHIIESEGQDFSTAAYVVFVVPLANIDSEKIVKAKYLPTEQGDYFKMPQFRLDQQNIPNGLNYPIKGTSGRYYSIVVDDSGEEPLLKCILQEGIPMSELPSNFPLFTTEGDFGKYYDYLIFCPVEGGVTNYLYELSSAGLVARYINKKLNCPRILKEDGTWYFYGVDGTLNNSNGRLNIYKANGETFELVKGDLGNSKGENIEPHDCLVLSVNPLHYICQRYVPNTTTVVDGESKVVTALHVEEVYEGTSVWEWNSEDYPELWTDSHYQGNNADYLHNNTISVASDGNLYLNNKQANQMLVIQRTWSDDTHTGSIGNILWKIGGNRTHSGWDVPTRIKTTDEQQWYESHDAVINSDGLVTMYDNSNGNISRILEFKIDTVGKSLTNFISHTWNQYHGRYMGSVDKCAEGVYLVSWGSSRSGNTANAGLYDFNTGKALFEIRFNATGSSAYRIYGIKKGDK